MRRALRFISMQYLVAVLLFVACATALPFSPQGEEEETPLWVRSGKFQGDIALNPEQQRAMRTGLINTAYRWKDATIPYKIRQGDYTQDQENFIKTSLEFYNKYTCVTVREATKADGDAYILITRDDSGCWSYVGDNTNFYRPQQLNLQHNSAGTCLVNGTVVHEFLHALGFYHMQSHFDRDNYVDILWNNIQSGTEGNFAKYTKNQITDYGCGFDYESVMEYTKYSFSKNGLPTIVAKDDPDRVLGQRVHLTEIDINMLDCMYVGYGSKCTCRC